MKITITNTEKTAPVTILHLDGTLDGANYKSLIDEAKKVYAARARDLILDMSTLTFISSAGLAALHQVALLFRGEKHPGQDGGWAAYHAIDRDRGSGTQAHVKLLSPTKQVREVLDMTGFNSLFEIYTDPHQASASFHQAAPAMEARLPFFVNRPPIRSLGIWIPVPRRGKENTLPRGRESDNNCIMEQQKGFHCGRSKTP